MDRYTDAATVNLLDPEAAAIALGCTARSVRRYVAAGLLTNHGTKRRILVSLDDLDTFDTRRVGIGA